ncbi:MAG: hypothetical protein ACLGIN_18490 [Candidatus Sericytochromatia bacterium]
MSTPKYELRPLTRKDFSAISKLQQKCKPMFLPWSPGQLESHLRVFPAGQWVVQNEEGELVASCSSLILSCPPGEEGMESWVSLTGNGYFHTHTLKGETLYAADLSVDPDQDYLEVRRVVYEKLRAMMEEHGLLRILAGGRIPGYAEVAEEMTPTQYVQKVIAGKAKDPILTFQLDYGFQVLGLMADHQNLERQARNFATLIEWRGEKPAKVKAKSVA